MKFRMPQPRSLKRDSDYFRQEFIRSHRDQFNQNRSSLANYADFSAQGREAWKTLSHEEKAPYVEKSCKDKIRYDLEKAEYNRRKTEYNMKKAEFDKNPPRSAIKSTCVKWKFLTYEQEDALTTEDKRRYDEDVKVFLARHKTTDYGEFEPQKKKHRVDQSHSDKHSALNFY